MSKETKGPSPGPWLPGPVPGALTVWSGDYPIASVYKSVVGEETAQRNFKLILAAPNLVGLIQELIEGASLADCGCLWHDGKSGCTHDQLTAAVDKARRKLEEILIK